MNTYTSPAKQQIVRPDRNADKMAEQVIHSVRRGEVEPAVPVAQKLLQRYPRHPGVQQAMAEVCVALGKFEDAIKHARQSVKLAPDEVMPYVVLAECYRKTHEEVRARKALVKAAKKARKSADMTALVGGSFEKMNAMDDALTLFKRANDLDPGNFEILQRIGGVQRFLGDLAGAEESYDKVLELNEKSWFIHYMRSGLRKQTEDNNHIEEMRSVLQRDTASAKGKAHLFYALAKEYEDLNDYKNSFRFTKLGGETQRRLFDYDLEMDLRTFDEIKSNFDQAKFNEGIEGCDSDAPFFILGMPRTGTTLVERILSSHSKVESLGELGLFSKLMVRNVKEQFGSQVIPEDQRTLLTSRIDFRKVGQGFVDGVEDRRDETPHFIDKLPFNFLHVGPIHLAMPNAKIIQLVRHPMDTCYSVYKQLFGSAYPFSYDLEELGRYFVAYTRLMEHWSEMMPGVIYQVRYEEMVANQEYESRRLIEHCGLEWEGDVIDFHKNTKASTTASASQIRSPIYSSSVQKWRQYEEQLAPLRRFLRTRESIRTENRTRPLPGETTSD